jgi:hypothetical protein
MPNGWSTNSTPSPTIIALLNNGCAA